PCSLPDGHTQAQLSTSPDDLGSSQQLRMRFVLLISRGKSGVSVYNPGFLWAPVSQATSHLRVHANDLRYRAVGRPDLLVVEEFEDLLERRVPNPQLVANGAEPTVQPVTATLGGGHSYGTLRRV
ncbi:MAG TPA: hypothetical protein VNZ26_21665, partial [Vicinamibacterales bacterium]|nr:hypothetical protein [Vicinamibacterales bacterium]